MSILRFEVSIAFSGKIVDNEEIMIVAENIAKAIRNQANGEGIAPEDNEAFTQIVEVKPQGSEEGVSLKIY